MSKFRETQARKYRGSINKRRDGELLEVSNIFKKFHTTISATEGEKYCQEIPTEIHVVVNNGFEIKDITLNAEMIAEIVKLDKAIKKDGGYSRPAEG